MSDAFTGTTELTSFIATAHEQAAYFSLRPQLIFDQFATVRATNETNPGSTVRFHFWDEMAEAITPLVETDDVTAVALGNDYVDVTLEEYGNAVLTTAKLNATSLINVDAGAANLVGYNAGISTDALARNALALGNNVAYGTGGSNDPTVRAEVQSDDTLAAADIRLAVTRLRAANVLPVDGTFYASVIHPDVDHDLRAATGAGTWRVPREYADPSALYTGELGTFEGVRFISNPRAKVFTNGGSGGTEVYCTTIMGQEALAKAVSMGGQYGEQPRVVMGPQTDKLRRHFPMGWLHFVGYKVFRQDAVRRIESASSVAP